MGILRGLRETVGFLTIIPTGERGLSDAPSYMFTFPLIGILIGSLSGLAAAVFFHLLPSLVAGTLTLGSLLVITGLHHADGLIDFGDGLMKMGRPSEKIRAMRDENVGAGGCALGFVVILTTVFAISSLGKIIVGSLVVCEASAKFSMVMEARMGRSAGRGTNTAFIETVEGASGTIQLFLALVASLVPAIWIFGPKGIFPLLGSVVTVSILVSLSESSFNGLTGDVFGATNDISRMVGLVLLLSVA